MTPEAGRVEELALIITNRARGDEATIKAAHDLHAALTTQAETIRQLKIENAISTMLNQRQYVTDLQQRAEVAEQEVARLQRLYDEAEARVVTFNDDAEKAEQRAEAAEETIRKQGQMIRDLTIAADAAEQRAEAAEGLSERMYTALNTVHAWASNRPNLEGTAFLRGVCEEFLRPRPATGEGA